MSEKTRPYLQVVEPTPENYARVARWATSPKEHFSWTAHDLTCPTSAAALMAISMDENRRVFFIEDGPSATLAAYGEVTFDALNNSAKIGRFIVNPDLRGRGIGPVALELILGQIMDGDLRRVELLVSYDNRAALRCYEKAGFGYEGTLRDARLFEGEYISMHVMSVLDRDAYGDYEVRRTQVNHVARVLMDAWNKAEPDHSITKNPTSYVATFVDLARAVVGSVVTKRPESGETDHETQP